MVLSLQPVTLAGQPEHVEYTTMTTELDIEEAKAYLRLARQPNYGGVHPCKPVFDICLKIAKRNARKVELFPDLGEAVYHGREGAYHFSTEEPSFMYQAY